MQKVVLASVLALSCSYPAIAQDARQQAPDATVFVVSAADLDLRTPIGERALKSRVRQAAVRACGDTLGEAAHPQEALACRISAVRGASPQVAQVVRLARSAPSSTGPLLASAVTVRVPR